MGKLHRYLYNIWKF